MTGDSSKAPVGKRYEGKVTRYVVMVCIVAASGGMVYGYAIGISGGVTSMEPFLNKFFPSVVSDDHDRNSYCKFDDQGLQLFTSSLYLAGLIASFVAFWVTQNLGRRPSMLTGGLCFLVGSILNAAAQNLPMLIIGRVMLGVGVGFANQAVPLYLSEMAPAHIRGALNMCFQLAVTLGILGANLINLFDGNFWRLSLGLAFVPAAILTMGGIFLPETPSNLIGRGRFEQGKAVLMKVRGTSKVDAEYEDIVFACDQAKEFKSNIATFRNLVSRRRRPQLAVAVLISFFQQVTGINAIMFYAPVLFKTIGLGSNAALFTAVITGVVNVVSTLISIATVDRVGRKALFVQGGIQMFICQIVVGIILKFKLPIDPNAQLDKSFAGVVVALICLYVAGFAWSWGPLGWLVPSEVFPLDIRSAAQSLSVGVNFFFSFVLGQAFLSMLCTFEWGIFLFFGGWVVIMTLYVIFFLPETKNRALEEMELVWAKHWYWKRFVGEQEFPDYDLSGKPSQTGYGYGDVSKAGPNGMVYPSTV